MPVVPNWEVEMGHVEELVELLNGYGSKQCRIQFVTPSIDSSVSIVVDDASELDIKEVNNHLSVYWGNSGMFLPMFEIEPQIINEGGIAVVAVRLVNGSTLNFCFK